MCWSIGDGKNVQIGLDPWVPGVPLFCPTINPRYACLETKKFKSLCLRSERWNSQLIKQIFVPEDAKAILNLVPPRSGSNGKLQWIHSKSGMFSVKDVYRYLNCGRNGQRNQVNPSNLWKLWWKMKLPPRLLLLGWKIGCASLATKVNLRRKTVYVSDLKCLLC